MMRFVGVSLSLVTVLLVSGCHSDSDEDIRFWSLPQVVSNSAVVSVSSPQVAVDPIGNAIALWEQNDDVFNRIHSNRYVLAERSWGAPVVLSDDVSAANAPDIAVDSVGNAFAVWDQSGDVLATRYNVATGVWDIPILISDGLTTASNARVVVDPSANAFVVWQQFDVTMNSIFSARFGDDTGLWSPPSRISAGLQGGENPQLVVDGFGNVIAVWDESGEVHVNRYDVDVDNWGLPTRLGVGENVKVGVGTFGSAIAVWNDSNGDIRAARYDPVTGLWGAAATVGIGMFPTVAVDTVGNALAMWQDAGNVISSYYDVLTNTWRDVEVVDSGGTIDMGIDFATNFIAAWNDGGNIRAGRYIFPQWGFPVTISIIPGGGSDPRIDVNAAGSAFVVWDGGNRVFFARFE